jgi:glycosyltransferase involved in cell wall biosynthesis
VELVGHTDDVPDALRRIGVILSTSVRESFHCALVEGAASGAVPVVRDWPFFAGYPHSARTLFWEDWVVATPEQAADRVRRFNESAETWREEGGRAQSLVLDRWDWHALAPGLDAVVLGGRMPARS